jgi:hypothetical protein
LPYEIFEAKFIHKLLPIMKIKLHATLQIQNCGAKRKPLKFANTLRVGFAENIHTPTALMMRKNNMNMEIN